MYKKEIKTENPRERRRGRPCGTNRTPLSLEERRARNAQYERERRNDTAEAMIELAEAAGCDSNLSNAELLAVVIQKIRMAEKTNEADGIAHISSCNEKLLLQITKLQRELSFIPDLNIEALSEEDAIPEIISNPRKKRKVQKKHISRDVKNTKPKKNENPTENGRIWSQNVTTEPAKQENPQVVQRTWHTPTVESQPDACTYSSAALDFSSNIVSNTTEWWSAYSSDSDSWKTADLVQSTPEENYKQDSPDSGESSVTEPTSSSTAPIDLDSFLGSLTEEEEKFVADAVQHIGAGFL